MSTKPTAGLKARTTTDAPTPEKPSEHAQCTRCGQPAAGLDANTSEPLCAACGPRRDAQTPTVYQARCPVCEDYWPARRLRSGAEGDASIHNELIHGGAEIARVEEVQP